MKVLWRDLRFGARILFKNPGFTLIAVTMLGLGIGVNTALFAGFNLLLRPNHLKDPETLVKIERQSEDADRDFSYSEYQRFRDHSQTLTHWIPILEDEMTLGENAQGAETVEVNSGFVADESLSELGGQMQLGRFFTKGETRTLVLSHYFWNRRFSEDKGVIGRTLLINGKPFQVIGVAAPEFVGLKIETPDIWLPLDSALFESVDWGRKPGEQWLSLYARIKPNNRVEAAEKELAELQAGAPEAKDSKISKKFISVASAANVGASSRFTIAVTLGASGLVLLIACSNIANMLLSRAAARQKEIGVRMALGATRGRVIRQLMTENILLAVSGGLAGVLLAWWSVLLLFPWVFARSDGRDFAKTAIKLSPDWRVLAFALFLSLLSGVVFGLIPALRAARTELVTVINNENAAFGGRLARITLRNSLVIAQVAFCLVLLIPAGLLARALTKGFDVDRGFEADHLLTVDYIQSLSGPNLISGDSLQEELIRRLSALKGVLSVTPQADFWDSVKVSLLEGRPPDDPEGGGARLIEAPFQWITAGFLQTIGTQVILGRGFSVEEVDSSAPVLIVSLSTARNFWPGQDPIGKTMRIEGRLRDNTTGVLMHSARVIGVAEDNQIHRFGHTPPIFLYGAQPPITKQYEQLLVRTEDAAAGMKELIRKEALAVGSIARVNVGTMAMVSGETASLNAARIASELAMALGALALLLATLGLYGVMTYTVAQRTREIGVRMALGARPGNVQLLVIGQGMRLVLIGMLIGVPLAIGASQLMKSMLFGLSTMDPLTYIVVAILLGFAGLAACWAPARQAARVNPMLALRAE